MSDTGELRLYEPFVNEDGYGDMRATSCPEGFIWSEEVKAALAKARKEGREEVRERQAVVVDFLDSWRFCPVSEAAAPARSCLEDAAKQLLDSLTKEGDRDGG